MKKLLLLASISLVSLANDSEFTFPETNRAKKTILSFMVNQYNDQATQFKFSGQEPGKVIMFGSNIKRSFLETIFFADRNKMINQSSHHCGESTYFIFDGTEYGKCDENIDDVCIYKPQPELNDSLIEKQTETGCVECIVHMAFDKFKATAQANK